MDRHAWVNYTLKDNLVALRGLLRQCLTSRPMHVHIPIDTRATEDEVRLTICSVIINVGGDFSKCT